MWRAYVSGRRRPRQMFADRRGRGTVVVRVGIRCTGSPLENSCRPGPTAEAGTRPQFRRLNREALVGRQSDTSGDRTHTAPVVGRHRPTQTGAESADASLSSSNRDGVTVLRSIGPHNSTRGTVVDRG
uniref:Uncharacterized protein n=1 Tax=Rhodococcus sp. NS1 TaxID=402236 RepID=A0A097SQE5_9NOCA|nr:hypothetical protein LRS1606.308 [Rhodococcus sp. NS1]